MSSQPEWLEAVSPCLREIGEEDRIFPKGKRIEVVFLVEAANYLLLRTEGPGYINAITLPESNVEVPVILPEKLQAVTRRKMLQLLRAYWDALFNADRKKLKDIELKEIEEKKEKLKKLLERASNAGYTKAKEHKDNGWNCTIQPPIASAGERATDIGMDGYCPACTLFGVALTKTQLQLENIGKISVGVKTRVHFDPAFATRRGIVPATHNKVSEGLLSTTGQALYPEVHVEPGTVFVGRVVLTEVTEPELKAFLYTLAHVEEIGGRAGVYGTVRVHLLGIRCGKRSATTALELAEELVKNGKTTISEAKQYLEKKIEGMGFKPLDSMRILEAVDQTRAQDQDKAFMELFEKLWESSIDFATKVTEWIQSLQTSEKQTTKKSGSKK